MPKISIVVPVYQTEAYLNRCFDSIRSQSFSDFEVIVVDDGSTDRSGMICDYYSEMDSRFVVLHQNNQGQAAARNHALDWIFENSDSEWITFIDSDDWVHKKYLERLFQIALDNSAELVSCKLLRTASATEECTLFTVPYKCNAEECWTTLRRGEAYAGGRLIARKLFENMRFPVGRIYEDSVVICKVIFEAKKIVLIDDELYYYYLNPESTTGKTWSTKKLDAIAAHEDQLAYFKANGYHNAWKTTMDYYIRCLAKCADNLSNVDIERKRYYQTRAKLRKALFINKRYVSNWEKDKLRILGAAFPKEVGVLKFFKKKFNNILEVVLRGRA